MARMVPPYPDSEHTSRGEREVFEELRDDPATEGWIVLHSLGLADHPTRLEGEADFVAIVPGHGVLCLEVKGCEVRREDGLWIYGSGHGERTCTRGPFRQASEFLHGLRAHVARADPALQRILFASAAVFTDIDLDVPSPEWHPWQSIGARAIAERGLPECCLDALASAHEHAASRPAAAWYDHAGSRPSGKQTERILDLIRGDFERFTTPRLMIDKAERAVHRFTGEQFRALDLIADNDRVLFRGPAGTGKTVLALEAARRLARSGRRTALFCFNRILGEWLAREAAREQLPALQWVNTFHHFLVETLGVEPSGDWTREVWEQELPDRFLDRALTGDPPVPTYEAIVIDEVQDLLRPRYLDVLDMILEGGLAGGTWAVFGDLEHQAIYTIGAPEDAGGPAGLLEERAPNFVRFPLRTNCRNSTRIARMVEHAFGLDPGYNGVLQEMDGSGVEAHFHGTPAEQCKRLGSVVTRLLRDYMEDEIAILSFARDERSCAAAAQAHQPGLRFQPLREREPGARTVGYCSVAAFKGMEAPVVILTDVDRLEDEWHRSLLYVGLTRARQHVVLLASRGSQHVWDEMTGR